MRVRAATPEDATAVAGVHVRSWQAGYRGLLPDEYLDALRPEDRAAHYRFDATDHDRPVTMLATEAETIVGFAAAGASADHDPDQRIGELFALYVDPSRWGCGIGRALLEDARNRLSQRGYQEARLWVLRGNSRAERFYRIDGWTADGAQREDRVWDLRVEEVGYCRALP